MQGTKQVFEIDFFPDWEMPKRAWPLLIALGFILAHYFLGGLKSVHLAVASLVVLDSYNVRTRLFLKSFFPFLLTAVLYDSMHYYYWPALKLLKNIHVSEPYFLEKSLFGITHNGNLLTLNEFFRIYTHSILDFFCGFAYITFVLEYLSMGLILFFSNRLKTLTSFAWCFFITNTLGFLTYYIYPAAPPWYVEKYGINQILYDIPASPAAAVRFDALLGTHFFTGMYGMSADLYGAFPSLHVSYPFLVMLVAYKEKIFRAPSTVFFFLMCFSAIYLQHHYVIDVVLGLIYASFSVILVKKLRKI